MSAVCEGKFPPEVRERVTALCMGARHPACVRIDPEGMAEDVAGDAAHHGIDALVVGEDVSERLPYFEGLLPCQEDEMCIPLVQTGEVTWANLHFVRTPAATYVLFLDASDEAQRLAALQQNSHELSLLRDTQEKTYAALRESHEHTVAILDQLALITAIVRETGQIEFLSAAGRQRFCSDGPSPVGRSWQAVFPFDVDQRARIRKLMTSPPDTRHRLRLLTEVEGRRFCYDLDVRDDPRGEGRRIFFLYDSSETFNLQEQLNNKAGFHELIGRSQTMNQVFRQIQDVAGFDTTVLIEGETGTGKELVARAIHFSSARKDGPFVVVNCAGLSESLINSQLFGHRKGAFTDAVRDQQGLFEAAEGGTIFLDEIGDIPMNAQTRILRVLENREVTRIGETTQRKVDIRVLAATNKDLQHEVNEGNFRLDLLYRIRVASISLPPLRVRREDIPLLAGHFLGLCAAATGKQVETISEEAMHALLDYPWIGNVRELRNVIEVSVLRCRSSVIERVDLPPDITAPSTTVATRKAQRGGQERARILDALERADGNRQEAAKLLGVSRATFYRRLKAAFHGNVPV